MRKILAEKSPTCPKQYENSWVSDDLRGMYIHDTKKTPQLPPEELARLSELVRAGIAATARLDDPTSVATVDELEALERAQKQGHDARNTIVTANTGLVFKWATHYAGRGVDYLDLIQAGNLGLIRAAEKFSPDKGATFGTYATRWIVSFMSTEIHEMSRTIRVQPAISAQIQKLRRMKLEYTTANGEDMSLGQLAEAMDKTEAEITELLGWEYKMESLDQERVSDDLDTRTLIDELVDRDAPQVEDVALDRAATAAIVKSVRSLLAVSTLDERSKDLVRRQFGIGYDHPMSVREMKRQGVLGKDTTIKKLTTAAMEQLKAEATLFNMADLLE